MDRTTKLLALGLAGSLALNLFFAGFALGRRGGFHRGPFGRGQSGMHHERMGRRHGPGMDLGPTGFLRRAGLPDAGPEVSRILDAQRSALRTQHGAVGRARAAVAATLRTEPFDAGRFAQTLVALRAETSRMQEQMHGAFVEVARTLSPEQRKRMADAPWFKREAGAPGPPPGPPPPPPP